MNNKDLQTLLDINSSSSFQELKDKVAMRLTFEQMNNHLKYQERLKDKRTKSLSDINTLYTN